MYVRSDPRRAALMDGTWTSSQLVGLLGLWLLDALSPASAVGVWTCGAALSAWFGSRWNRTTPAWPYGAVRFVKRVMRLGAWFTLADVLYSIGAQSTTFIVGSSLGRAAVGGLRAAQNLFAPAQLIGVAIHALGLPEVSRAWQRGPDQTFKVTAKYGVALLTCSFAYSGLMALVGVWLLTYVFGQEFREYDALVYPMALSSALTSAGLGAVLALRAARCGKQLATAQVFTMCTKVTLQRALRPTACPWRSCTLEST